MKKNLKVVLLLLAASVLIMACGLGSQPTLAPDADLSGLVLTAADFPESNFSEVNLGDMGMSVDDLNSEEFKVESFFSLLESNNFEMVMGLTTRLDSQIDRTGFDLVLKQPETLLEAFLGGMGDINTSETKKLLEFDNTIGDSSSGMTVVAKVQGMGMGIDIVVFRHGSIGSFAVVMYLAGQEPSVSLMDVATKFDAKIGDFLANQ